MNVDNRRAASMMLLSVGGAHVGLAAGLGVRGTIAAISIGSIFMIAGMYFLPDRRDYRNQRLIE